MASKPRKVLSLINRHQTRCTICRHPDREEIEREFLAWRSPAKIVAEYKLRNRSAIYRHANAFGLEGKRGRNLRAALGRLIERVDDVAATAGAIVQAIGLFAKINSRGELVEPAQQFGLHELFAKMNRHELLDYAQHGTLPDWFTELVGTETSQAQENDDD